MIGQHRMDGVSLPASGEKGRVVSSPPKANVSSPMKTVIKITSLMHGVVTFNGILSRTIIISLLIVSHFLAFTPLLPWNPIFYQLTHTCIYEIRIPLPDICNSAHTIIMC